MTEPALPGVLPPKEVHFEASAFLTAMRSTCSWIVAEKTPIPFFMESTPSLSFASDGMVRPPIAPPSLRSVSGWTSCVTDCLLLLVSVCTCDRTAAGTWAIALEAVAKGGSV